MDALSFKIEQMDFSLRIIQLTSQAEQALLEGDQKKATGLLVEAETALKERQQKLENMLQEME